MSYNKSTVVTSNLDQISYVLSKVGKVKIETLGEVKGFNIYDDLSSYHNYPIRKLTFNDFVIMEQMQRTHDCDCDDTIISVLFDADKVPTNWPLDIYIGEE